MGDTSTKISIPMLKVLDTCDHVMLAFEVTNHHVIISINHLQKYFFIARYFKSRSTQNCIEIISLPGRKYLELYHIKISGIAHP